MVAATRWTGERDEGVVVGLTADGALDASFGSSDGIHVLGGFPSSRLRAVRVEPSGAVLAVGSAFAGAHGYDLALARIE